MLYIMFTSRLGLFIHDFFDHIKDLNIRNQNERRSLVSTLQPFVYSNLGLACPSKFQLSLKEWYDVFKRVSKIIFCAIYICPCLLRYIDDIFTSNVCAFFFILNNFFYPYPNSQMILLSFIHIELKNKLVACIEMSVTF